MTHPNQPSQGVESNAHASRARARVLAEALPALVRLKGAVVVVKYGGAAMEDPGLADGWAHDVALLGLVGLKPVIVHGGGPELTRMLARLGLESRFVDGHRVTSPEAAEVAEMVLSGRINLSLVSRLNRAGARAIGLSGTDGGLLSVRPLRPKGVDIGQVGEVAAVDPEPIRVLLAAGYVPVISSTASDRLGQSFNVNADLVAGAIAAALGATALVYLSDVAGVRVHDQRVPLLGVSQARALIAGSAEVTGGMLPKLEGAALAAAGGVGRVHLVDGRVRHALLTELLYEQGTGTLVVPDADAPAELLVAMPAAAARATPVVAAPSAAPSPAPAWAGTLAERGARSVLLTYTRYPIEIVDGHGAWVRDAAGRSYLDFVAGIAVNALGHGHPAITGALASATKGILHASNLYWTEPMVRLAERLVQATGMERAFFCNSGAEAVEAAIKVARKARPGRPGLVVLERSFHGRTLGALSVTLQKSYQDPFRPLLPGVVGIPFGDFDAAAAAIDTSVAAVLVEPIQGEGGVRPCPPGFLGSLRKACDRAGALLIVDEVQTGLGRTGRFLACEHEGVRPDAVAIAKALGGGLPMGALLTRGDAANALGPGEHGSTFGGGPLVATVALAVLDVILAPGFLASVARKGELLGAGLRAIAQAHAGQVSEARGNGLMWGLVLAEARAKELVAALHGHGLLTVPAGPDVLRLLPPLTVTEDEIAQALARIEMGVAALASASAA